MKKIIFICLLALVSGLAVTSCTDETITPLQSDAPRGVGGGSDPLK